MPITTDENFVELKEAYKLACSIYNHKRANNDMPMVEFVVDLVSITVGELNLGYTSAISALFGYIDLKNADLIKYITSIDHKEAFLVIESFQKISDLPTERLINNIDNFTGIMLNLASDVRSILLSFAENLLLLRHYDRLDAETHKSTIAKALNIYIPLSHKLGLYKIKSEAEELTFRIQMPETYMKLQSEIESEINKSKDFINRFTQPIVSELSKLGLKFTITSRTKSVSSVYNKMVKQKVNFNEVYDLFAIRIIIDTPQEEEKAECWKAYSIVTNLYQPDTNRMRDWITQPRANGYESLHITVIDQSKRMVEVQIRSQRMHKDAESGGAAHWRYKGHKGSLDTYDWMKSVREIIENPTYTEELLSNSNISNKKPDNIIYVFTPAGDLVKLKDGSTVLDFAFELHTAIGARCSGGRVNHKIVPIRQKLKNGDIVEILTSKNQTPNRDWLGWVVSSRAKSKIKRYLKEAEFKQAEIGKDILRRKIGQLKMTFNDETVNKLIAHFKFTTSLQLYQQLAENKIDITQIKDVLVGHTKEIAESPVVKELTRLPDRTAENTIIVNESAELQGYILAQCCNPVMGDEIFGFVMTLGGIKIHRTSCPNAPRLKARYPYRVMEAQWSKVADGSYFISTIQVSGVDRLGILNSITELLSKELKIDVRNISLNSKAGKFEGFIKVSVRDSKHIDSLMKKIETVKGVTRVKRVQ